MRRRVIIILERPEKESKEIPEGAVKDVKEDNLQKEQSKLQEVQVQYI